MANGTHVDELTPAVPANLADTDLVYVGLPGDADPDRKMTLSNLRAYLDDYFALLTGATFTGDVNMGANVYVDGREIVDFGTGSGGVWIRFYNGIQICYTTASVVLSSAVAASAGVTWPASFASSSVRAVGNQAESDGLFNISIFSTTATGGNVTAREVRNIAASRTVPVFVVALGVWY